MAYEPKTWECGEVITADAMNHIEQGIANCCGNGNGLLLEVTETRTPTTEELSLFSCERGQPQ